MDMTPKYPRLLKDRDKLNDWYLDEDVVVPLTGGHTLRIQKGFRFDSHSVPWYMRWLFPRYLPTADNYKNDIYAAMVHDYLIATEHWHRFSRSYMDEEYRMFMNMSEYKMSDLRSKWMPWGVKLNTKIKYLNKDYRGAVKPNTRVFVSITNNIE